MASIFDPDLVANKQPNWTDSSAHRQPVELKPDDRPDGTNCKPDASADLLTHKPVDLLPNKHCFAHRLKPSKYKSLAVAQSECRDDPKCGGIYKPLGWSDEGDGAYFLCDEHPADDSDEGGQVWGKPQGMTVTKVSSVGVRKSGKQAGKWCSNWCCCMVGWHGEACDDADECVSAPCQHGGTCAESSSTYLVNDYFRKYRCTCPANFHGHNCDKEQEPRNKGCALQLGAKSASGSTSTIMAYRTFQVALEFTGITLRSSDTNFERMCADIYEHHEHGGVCGQQFVLWAKSLPRP